MATRRTAKLGSHLLGGRHSLGEFVAKRRDTALVELVVDPLSEKNAPNKRPRPVLSGHYVHVRPTPLGSPYLVGHSEEMAMELGLDFGSKQEQMTALLSGDLTEAEDLTPWCTPYAVSVFGSPIVAPDPFGTGDGYGDGRAVTLGEFAGIGSDGRCWELQLKGGGSTPFGRGHDGRAVLRSSVREFLVSEAMHHLGVSTTRALSLVASRSDRVARAWYPPDVICSPRPPTHLVEERCAITCRAAPSFIRVGHFELYSRRVVRRQGREVEAMVELTLLAAHTLRREFPHLLPPDIAPDTVKVNQFSGRALEGTTESPVSLTARLDAAAALVTPARVVSLLREHARRQAALVTGWCSVGYVQGNMNSDNVLVGGRTMDFGPFGFVERFEPGWTPFTSDPEGKFGFLLQPRASHVNLVTFARSLVPLLGGSQEHLDELQRIVSEEYPALLAAEEGEMRRTKLGLVVWDNARDGPHLWDPLGELLGQCAMDWTLFFRQLAPCLALAEPEDGPDPTATLLTRQLDLLRVATYDPRAFDARAQQWRTWLVDWRDSVLAAAGETIAAGGALRAGAALIRASSPKYVPREWMLVEAYEAAERGDHEVLHGLQRLFAAPFDEHGEDDERRYFRRCPEEMRGRAGVSFFS